MLAFLVPYQRLQSTLQLALHQKPTQIVIPRYGRTEHTALLNLLSRALLKCKLRASSEQKENCDVWWTSVLVEALPSNSVHPRFFGCALEHPQN